MTRKLDKNFEGNIIGLEKEREEEKNKTAEGGENKAEGGENKVDRFNWGSGSFLN